MSVRRLVVLTDQFASDSDIIRMGLPTLVQEGLIIEVWDLANILYSKSSNNKFTLGHSASLTRKVFSSRIGFAAALLKLNKHDMVLNYFFFCRTYCTIYFLLTIARCEYLGIVLNAVPQHECFSSSARSFWDRVRFKAANLTLLGVANSISNYAAAKTLNLLKILGFFKSARLICLGGEECASYYKFPSNNKTRRLWLHSYDYEKFITQSDEDGLIQGDYAVFLDEYMPFHPDWGLLGIKAPVTADRYYASHRAFFDYLEHTFGLTIAIAAHPKVNHKNYAEFFGGRVCRQGQTHSLVKGARFVITSFSTSVNFAVLHRKPILFVHTSEFRRSSLGMDVNRFASWFNKNSIEIDTQIAPTLDDQLKVDEACYENYVNMFIRSRKSQVVGGSMWTYFASEIRKLEF